MSILSGRMEPVRPTANIEGIDTDCSGLNQNLILA